MRKFLSGLLAMVLLPGGLPVSAVAAEVPGSEGQLFASQQSIGTTTYEEIQGETLAGVRTVSVYPEGTTFTWKAAEGNIDLQQLYWLGTYELAAMVDFEESFTPEDREVYAFEIQYKDGREPEIAYFKIGDSSDLGPADVPSGTEVGGFSDVQQSDYFADAVLWAVDRGITNGTSSTTFSPGATCTRGQILTFLWRAMGSPEPTEANPFLDVSQDAYYAKAACWAKEEGLFVSPAGSYVFLGETPCTRSETVLYLWRLAGSPATAASSAFQDVDHNAEYAQAVAWAVEQGITQGTSATAFSPDMTCTRGQIVTFLHRDLA